MSIRLAAINRLLDRSPVLRALASSIGLKAGEPGEKIAPGITRIRGNLCNVHGRYGPCDKAKLQRVNYNAPKGGKAAKGKKPKAAAKPKETPEEKAAKLAQTKKDTLSKAGFNPEEVETLQRLAKSGTTSPDDLPPAAIEALTAKGLIEAGSDGKLRLTPMGRSLDTASSSGDAVRVEEVAGRARDAVVSRADAAAKRTAQAAEVASKRAQRAAEIAQRKAEREAAKSGKAGSGGRAAAVKPKEEPKPTPEEKAERTAQEASQKLGLDPGTVEALSAAAEGRPIKLTGDNVPKAVNPLVAAGLVTEGDSTETTEEGVRALRALRRGDIVAYQDAVRDAKQRMEREAEKARKAAEREARANGPKKPTGGDDDRFTAEGLLRRRQAITRRKEGVLKARRLKASPAPAAPRLPVRWISITTTAHRDRAKEYVSRQSIAKSIEAGPSGPLRYWHVLGLDLGPCDFQAAAGDTGELLVESGTFYGDTEALVGARMAERNYQMSPGFDVTRINSDDPAVFEEIEIFERSGTPSRRSMNPFTAFDVIYG